MKLLSLCTGYGGLDLAVEEFFGAELIGCADIDKSANLAIEKHFGVPNYGDIRNILGLDIEFDILTAGYPCQPFSHAGQRKGLDDERHIWPHIAEIIGKFRPGIVVLENVRGHLSLGFKEVLKDLTELGYDARWQVIRASDVGAPHQRARLFIIAYPVSQRPITWITSRFTTQESSTESITFDVVAHSNSSTCEQSRRADRAIRREASEILDRADRQKSRGGSQASRNSDDGSESEIRPFPGLSTDIRRVRENARNTDDKQLSADGQMQELGRRFETRLEMSMRAIPDPLVDGKLSTKFVEYMMGLPEGWVTDLPISRAQQFKLLGNGVVPQQAFYALEQLCRNAF